MVEKILLAKNSISYAKRTGLRSMQHIKGIEREVIKAYKSELTHEIWGNPDKLVTWVKNKIEQLINKDYTSELLDREVVNNSRNGLVKAWGQLLKSDFLTYKNPFLQLDILKFITEKLKNNNKLLAPVLRKDAFRDALSASNRTGKSFKKIYTDLIKDQKYHGINIEEENVQIGAIRGSWYHFKTPNKSEAVRAPGVARKFNDFIMSISQGSDWCIRNKYSIEGNYTGTYFHIFIDDKSIPQLCLAGCDKEGKLYRYVRGREQYKPIPEDYKKVLMDFLEKRNAFDAEVLTNEDTTIPILKLCS